MDITDHKNSADHKVKSKSFLTNWRTLGRLTYISMQETLSCSGTTVFANISSWAVDRKIKAMASSFVNIQPTMKISSALLCWIESTFPKTCRP
jgi:hypothetical protein